MSAWAGWGDFPPELEPILGTEATEYGWRGITSDGAIIESRARNGTRPSVPESIMISDGATNRLIGRREIRGEVVDVTAYLGHFSRSVVLHKANENEEALAASDAAIAIAPTLRARFNRAMVLLALGRWREGFDEFERCERLPPFLRPMARRAIEAGLQPWRGEDINGRRLLVIHDHGFGDTIMMLRYVATLRAMGADVVLLVPLELKKLAVRFADVVDGIVAADYFVSFLQLLRWLGATPDSVPTGPYIAVDDPRCDRDRRRVGVAWSTRVVHDGDFPRALPLADLLARIDVAGAEVHSVQVQGVEEAESLGVITHDLVDFALTASLMASLDEIVSVDTAAIHLAGAIGHPRATLLLSRWHSWRWNGNPFYPDVRIREV